MAQVDEDGQQLGKLIDGLKIAREKRLIKQREVEALKHEEDAVEQRIINALRKLSMTSGRGKKAQATIVPKVVPVIEDYDALIKYMKRTGSFELVQRRLAVTAVRERWDAGKDVPGVGKLDGAALSLTGVK